MVGDGFHLVDHSVPVGYGFEHPQLVFGFVGGVAALADEVGFYVGGDLEEGGGGEVGFAHSADGVGGAGAGAGDEDAGFAGGAGVAVGHKAAAEFEASADEAEGVLAVKEGIEQVEVVDADDAEDGVYALGFEGFGNGLAAG